MTPHAPRGAWPCTQVDISMHRQVHGCSRSPAFQEGASSLVSSSCLGDGEGLREATWRESSSCSSGEQGPDHNLPVPPPFSLTLSGRPYAFAVWSISRRRFGREQEYAH